MVRQPPPELVRCVGSHRFEWIPLEIFRTCRSAHRIRGSAIHSLYYIHYAAKDVLRDNQLFVYQRETSRSMCWETGAR